MGWPEVFWLVLSVTQFHRGRFKKPATEVARSWCAEFLWWEVGEAGDSDSRQAGTASRSECRPGRIFATRRQSVGL